MCGIVGYTGHQPAQKIVIESLKKLEYRGYDSSGIATKEDKLVICKIQDLDTLGILNYCENMQKSKDPRFEI